MIQMIFVFYLVTQSVLVLGSTSSEEADGIVNAARNKNPVASPLPKAINPTSRPARFLTQAHLKQASSSMTVFSPRAKEALSKDKLIIFTPTGKEEHETYHVLSKYDPVEAFRKDHWIAENSLRSPLLGSHSSSLFENLKYEHVRCLFLFLSGKKGWSSLLLDWDFEQVRSRLSLLTSDDVATLSKNSYAAYYLGYFFKLIPPRVIEEADIPKPALLEMFCCLSNDPSLYFFPQEYGLDFILQNHSEGWIMENLKLLSFKTGYLMSYERKFQAFRLIRSKETTTSLIAEAFFRSSSVVEDGMLPFTRAEFKTHSPVLFKKLTESHLKHFLVWASNSDNFMSDPDEWDLPRLKSILSKLTMDDIQNIVEIPNGCAYLARVFSYIPLNRIPTDMEFEKLKILTSRVSKEVLTDPSYHSPKIFGNFEPALCKRMKAILVEHLVDHFPRSSSCTTSNGSLRLTQDDIEAYFWSTGRIIDNYRPFSTAGFGKRSQNLLLNASHLGIKNLIDWITAGSISRAKSLACDLNAPELRYIQTMNLVHILAPLFPLLDIDVVIEANLLKSSMIMILNNFKADPSHTFEYEWDLLLAYPKRFFDNPIYLESIFFKICERMDFKQMPYDLLTRLVEISPPKSNKQILCLYADLTLQNLDLKFKSVTKESMTILNDSHFEPVKEKVLATIAEYSTTFGGKIEELHDQIGALESGTASEQSNSLVKLKKISEDLKQILHNLINLCQRLLAASSEMDDK